MQLVYFFDGQGQHDMNQLDMQGRHAVVTGGASGLGLAIVQRLLHSGARVTIWDYDQKGMDKSVSELRLHLLFEPVNQVSES
jgi:3-oxoacyl-[acyl-carrier protein] reductase